MVSESTCGARCAAALRTGGDPVRLRRRSRRIVPRRLVLLCDISGSMEPYARVYLQFLTSAARTGRHAEAFVFATRLTRLTRALGSRNPARAIQNAAAAAPDWSSGTRIGDALKQFNDRHGRRGMARGAVVVILSDGWERGDPTLVGREMERLAPLGSSNRVGQPSRRRRRVRATCRRNGRSASARRRAGQRTQPRRARRGDRRDRGFAAVRRKPPRRSPSPKRSRGRARRPSPAARSRCRADTGRAGAGRRRGGGREPRPPADVHLSGLRPPGGRAARARRPALGVLRPRGAQRAERASRASAPRRHRRRAVRSRRRGG